VALSGDGRRALTGSSDDTAILWDLESGAPIRILKGHTASVESVALSGDGRRALTGSWDHTAILWDLETGAPLRTLKGHTSLVFSVAISGDGRRALTGSSDDTAILWDLETARAIQTYHDHNGCVSSVTFAPKSSLLVTASDDGTVRFWSPGREDMLFGFLNAGDDWLAWTPEGYYNCSPNGERLIAWKVDGETPGSYRIVSPDQFHKTFYRPDLFRHLFREGDLTRALAAADRERGPAAKPTDLPHALPPYATLLSPRQDIDIEAETLTVEAVAYSNGDQPVTRLRLQVDGRPYDGGRSDFDVPEARPGEVKRSWMVNFDPGEHTIQFIAESAVSEGRSKVIRVRRKSVVETLPRLFVLAVGISDYENEGLRKDVYYAAADARKFADTVEKSSKPLYCFCSQNLH
jgi:hypothetical protein